MTGTPHIRGWHPDPQDDTQLRYWDGSKWGRKTIPARPGAQRSSEVPAARQGGLTVNWSSAFSFRVIFAAFFMAVLVAILPSMVSSAFGGVVFVLVFLAVYGMAIFNPNAAVLYCPHCRKRVKVGADTCHHCGKLVAA